MGQPPTTASEDAPISRNQKEKYKNPQGFFPTGQTLMESRPPVTAFTPSYLAEMVRKVLDEETTVKTDI